MSEKFVPTRNCPQCGSQDYLFRSRKKLADEVEAKDSGWWETKFRCKSCEEVWCVRESLVRSSNA
jgi:transposase-like protein